MILASTMHDGANFNVQYVNIIYCIGAKWITFYEEKRERPLERPDLSVLLVYYFSLIHNVGMFWVKRHPVVQEIEKGQTERTERDKEEATWLLDLEVKKQNLGDCDSVKY